MIDLHFEKKCLVYAGKSLGGHYKKSTGVIVEDLTKIAAVGWKEADRFKRN